MITNATLLPPLVQALMDAPFEFQLTGSRFFGGVHADSDWDFITENHSSVEAWLLGSGYEIDERQSYSDPSITRVLYGYCTHEGRQVKVDIQLVKDVKTKLLIQDALKKHWTQGLPCDKETKRVIWNAAYAVVKHVG